MTDLLKFDIYAMTQPQTRQDIDLMLAEALSEINGINDALDAILAQEPQAV